MVPREEIRRLYVKNLFKRIANDYDRLNSIISLCLHQLWRRKVLSFVGLKRDSYILDVCTGTADFAIQAARIATDGKVMGIDFCKEMLEVGRRKVERFGLSGRVELMFGEASSLPFNDNTFDCITMGFGLRHVDIRKALQEMLRVARPGAKVVTLDVSRPRNRILKTLHYLYFYKMMPMIGQLLSGHREPYSYLPISLDRFLPSQEKLMKIMEDVGLRDVRYFELSGGVVAVHVGMKS
jgi:demethylmenaquinone methyltransferase/2-methoxy-6-polyprenyl-1,4-benzoquinol methylase